MTDYAKIAAYVPVCMPRAAPSPRRVRKRTSGNNPIGGAALFLSVAAMIMNAKTAAPRNSEKKHVVALIYSSLMQFQHHKTV